MGTRKKMWSLKAHLSKEGLEKKGFRYFLNNTKEVITIYESDKEDNYDYAIYVEKRVGKRPEWLEIIESFSEKNIEEIENRSSAAVLMIRLELRLLVFSFGYGRYLINENFFEQDFGLKTALNTIDHDSLRSVDLQTFEEQPILRRAQAASTSQMHLFGVDVFTDILRSVSGKPMENVPFKSITGRQDTYSFSIYSHEMDFFSICSELVEYYSSEYYKINFPWVDNIKVIKDKKLIEDLDGFLVTKIKSKGNIGLSIPDILEWDEVDGFIMPRTRREVYPLVKSHIYLSNINKDSFNISRLKNDQIEVVFYNGEVIKYSVYKCIYYEAFFNNNKYLLFSGEWLSIESNFYDSVIKQSSLIEKSEVEFPDVYYWMEEEDGKNKKIYEREDAYNERISKEMGCYLLDKKLVGSRTLANNIEICDLLTNNRQIIHVKHRKGGSSALSHLFAQGRISSEVLRGDRNFREEAVNKFKDVYKYKGIDNLIPVDNFEPREYEVIFLLLGQDSSTIVEKLPFFSKLNLLEAYKRLKSLGFSVFVAGANERECNDPV